MSKNLDFIINTDGGARGNPGPAAVGVVVRNNQGQVVDEYDKTIGRATNNVAEYQAAVFALSKLKAVYGKKKAKTMNLKIKSDSELLVKQISHQYKIANSGLQKLFLKLWNLMLDFNEVDFVLVNREDNKEADKLVNEALDREQRENSLFD